MAEHSTIYLENIHHIGGIDQAFATLIEHAFSKPHSVSTKQIPQQILHKQPHDIPIRDFINLDKSLEYKAHPFKMEIGYAFSSPSFKASNVAVSDSAIARLINTYPFLLSLLMERPHLFKGSTRIPGLLLKLLHDPSVFEKLILHRSANALNNQLLQTSKNPVVISQSTKTNIATLHDANPKANVINLAKPIRQETLTGSQGSIKQVFLTAKPLTEPKFAVLNLNITQPKIQGNIQQQPIFRMKNLVVSFFNISYANNLLMQGIQRAFSRMQVFAKQMLFIQSFLGRAVLNFNSIVLAYLGAIAFTASRGRFVDYKERYIGKSKAEPYTIEESEQIHKLTETEEERTLRGDLMQPH